ncbi:hypothetical protein OS493_031423 [Desmophyllum pertusum]|uniref:Uncharacterized protein n=1 Tax=Desmophyllum pertusum TaxID=174260 RepID=A0A9X0A0L0_9CNID|nr:hypothetical protein OS493_031423 [Desmophyllum pertusum]
MRSVSNTTTQLLVSRILVEHLDCFSFLKDVCIFHIPHKHSKEMAKKSETLPMGVLFKNENLTEDMIEILRHFQAYLPYTTVDDKKIFLKPIMFRRPIIS